MLETATTNAARSLVQAHAQRCRPASSSTRTPSVLRPVACGACHFEGDLDEAPTPAHCSQASTGGTSRRAALLTATAALLASKQVLAPPSAFAAYDPEDFTEEAGFTVSETGLAYKVLQEGTGNPAFKFVPNPFVKVNFEGFLMNGKKFASTLDDRRTFGFQVGLVQRVTPGFDEAVYGMRVGEKRLVYVPAELGFGRRGMPSGVPPNAELVYEVELLSIQPY